MKLPMGFTQISKCDGWEGSQPLACIDLTDSRPLAEAEMGSCLKGVLPKSFVSPVR
jgi:hypothetical protein